MRTRRTTARLAALALSTSALGAGLGVLASATPAAAASATYGTTTRVAINDQIATPSNTTPIVVPSATATPAAPYPSQIAVSGQPGTITDVNVTLSGVSHTFPDDLDVLLVGPSGQQVILMSDAGSGFDVADVALTFDDQAAAPLPDSAQILAGSYKPSDYLPGDVWPAPAPSTTGAGTNLGAVNGDSPNGTWSLYVSDDAAGDGGQITSWQLTISTDSSPTPSTTYPSTINVSGAPKGITDVNVSLTGLTHFFPADLDMLLVGPGGQQAMLLSDAGGATDVNDVNLVFDDSAPTAVPNPIVAGTYQPTNVGGGDTFPAPAPAATGATPLAAFNGTDPNGTWSLYIVDDAAGDRGSLAGWSLTISTVDTPAAPAISAPATGSRDRDGAFTVAGNAPGGTSVKVLDGGAVVGTTTASAIGQWAVPLAGLHNGSHSLTATASDGFGNTSAASPAVVVIVDSIKPVVASTVPLNRAKKVSPTANVTAKMSEAVRKLTVNKSTAFLVAAGTKTHVKAKVVWKPGTRTVVIDPAASLRRGTTYQVTVTTSVLDLAGNPLDQNRTKSGLQKKTWTFTTR